MRYRMHLRILAGMVHCVCWYRCYCAIQDALAHPSWYGTLCLGTACVHPRWYGTLCLGTGATVPYRMHLCILAGMVHCVFVQVLPCHIGCIGAS